MSPVVNFLVRKKISRSIASAGVLLISIVIVGGLMALLSSQASRLHHAWPILLAKLELLMNEAVTWAAGFLNIKAQKINNWMNDVMAEYVKSRNAAMSATLTSVGGIVEATVLTPVYIYMILFYQPHLLEFVHKIFGIKNDDKVSEILSETKATIQHYIAGLFGEFIIISILNSIGLLALGIEYAVLLGIIGAMLNVIPIIGGIICVALFVIIALLTKAPIYVLYVVGLYSLIQFIDDHYIFPKIVGSKVKLNLLISIIAVILGNALWGIPGMFLAIPLVAIVKLIFDRVNSLESWGYLMGSPPGENESESGYSIKNIVHYFSSKIHKTK